MNALLIMIPVTLLLSGAFIAAFIWAARNGQWNDLDLKPKRIMNHDNEERINE